MVGSYRIDGTNIGNIVYGVTTEETYNGFKTEIVNEGFLIDGKPLRAVKKEDPFMPFSNFSYDGYRIGGEVAFTNKWANVGRFVQGIDFGGVVGNNDTEIRSVYYEGGGTPYSLGKLYIGNTRVIDNVPSVLGLYLVAPGGIMGDSVYITSIFGRVNGTGVGGGAGSGGFAAVQIDLGYSRDKNLIGYVRMGKYVSLYDGNKNLIVEVGNGSNGGNASGGVTGVGFDVWVSNGVGGEGGSLVYYGFPNNVRNLIFTQWNGQYISYVGFGGNAGGNGGWVKSNVVGEDTYYLDGMDGGRYDFVVFLNTGINGKLIPFNTGAYKVSRAGSGNGGNFYQRTFILTAHNGVLYKLTLGVAGGNIDGWTDESVKDALSTYGFIAFIK